MPIYNIKQECKVYLVAGASRYELEVYPDLTFSQTFEEKTVTNRNLHELNNFFDGAIVNKANPANFNFTVLLGAGQDFKVLSHWATLGSAYDIYVSTGSKIYKIQTAVVERATFTLTTLATVSLQGTAAKISPTSIVPGLSAPRIKDRALIRSLRVLYNNIELTSNVSITVELANIVEWLNYDTIHKSLYVSNTDTSQYPEYYTITNKVLSGTIQQYLTENSTRDGWTTGLPLLIIIDNYLAISLKNTVVTKVTTPDQIFTQNLTFRLISNSSSDFIERITGGAYGFEFISNSYSYDNVIEDMGDLFQFIDPGALASFNFSGGTYVLR